MKLYWLAAFIILTVTQQQCTKNTTANIPACIQERINKIKAQPKWNPPAEVNEYEYNGRKLYLFSSDCCDQYNEVYDSRCNYICAPSGGITGKGDRKCEDFTTNAKHIRLVWKDDR
jgi:hypothetical protein